VPDKRRGFYTSFIQITATLGLFIAILVVIIVQRSMSPEQFILNGYRIPFLISVILVGMSLYIRLRMKESPIFSGLKAGGKTSTTPLKDALSGWENWKRILRTLFGATAGQGVVWYTGQFYALFYLTTILKLQAEPARIVIAVGLLLGMPLFTFFGSLSDRIGRKKIMMAGCLLAAVFYIPIYHGMVKAANTEVARLAAKNDPVTGEPKLTALRADGKPITVKTDKNHQQLLAAGGVTPAKDPNYPLLVFYIFIQMIFVCMVYGPIAAYLVEAFPAKVRYTSLSLPYHIGNGVFGGLLPLIGLYVNSATKDIYAGLYYPIAIATLTFVVGSLTLRETSDVRIWDELEATRRGEAVPA
jgi:MFS family permease